MELTLKKKENWEVEATGANCVLHQTQFPDLF